MRIAPQHPPKSGNAVFNLPGAPAFPAVGAIAKMATLLLQLLCRHSIASVPTVAVVTAWAACSLDTPALDAE